MNKLFLLTILSVMSLTAFADDGASDMIFKFQDGSEQSIGAENLEMTFDDGSIIADNGVISLNIPLSNLQQFYFGSSAGIETLAQEQSDWSVYDLDGKYVGKFSNLNMCRGHLQTGIYIAKNTTATIKIALK